MSNAIDQQLQTAFSLHRAGNLDKAATIYCQIIDKDPNNFIALQCLGIIEASLGHFEQAKSLMARSVMINPPNIQFIENYAMILFQTGSYNSALQICQKGLQLDQGNISLLYVSAISKYKLRQLQESLIQFDKVLSLAPNHIAAINERGSVLAEMKKYDVALASFEKALKLQPQYAEAWLNRGNVLSKLKRHDHAFAAYDKALAFNPNLPNAWIGRGNSERVLKRYNEALTSYEKALALEPDLAGAWLGRGNVFYELKRYDNAFSSYEKALVLEPDLASAWLGRGNIERELKRYNDALASYEKALAFESDLAGAWLGRGNVFYELKRYDNAFSSYEKALVLEPDVASAWLGRGNIERELKRYDDAFASYEKALALEPDLAGAWVGRGNVFYELKHHDDAFASYEKALALEPDVAGAWLGRGNVFYELKRYDDAFVSYEKALALEPDLTGAEGTRLHCKMHLCDWSNFTTECEHLVSLVENNKTNVEPFSFTAISISREDQLKCAKLWISEKYGATAQPIWSGEKYNHDKIRVGYVSADFYQHATSHLMAGMFECHDKTQFEITAVSIGPDDTSELRNRLKNAFDYFIDGRLLSDAEIVHRIKQKEIDILIDLKGFTQDARTGIFARRPAPIQVNYLGFPGTMGANYIDYVIADRTLVPQSHQQDYSEKVVYLPNSYQVNDTKRAISEKVFSREEMGLTKDSFVFCCFNNGYKILPDVFECWMRILKRVDGSVLWLLKDSARAVGNLRKEAECRGVDPNRLIFASYMPLPDHLARHSCADLFLDTLPYNAHTTASDALWSGLPVLTQIGETFAGRVAASLLTAIGLPELITSTPQAYEDLAIELATNPEKLAAIKRKVADNRLTTPLFDTQVFTQHIERAYQAIYERYQTGLSPDHLYVTQ